MGFKITKNNSEAVLSALKQQSINALEICGGKAESYAKHDAPKDEGTLRNSIAHTIDTSNLIAYVGTNLHYAPYVEFGTGIYYAGGRKTPWVYQDSKGHWHMTKGSKAQPYLKPSVANHEEEYHKIIESILKGN